MTAEQIAERLHGRPCGRGWLARCPAHDDRAPSLSIADGTDGRVLVYCFAGCQTRDVLAAGGLRWADIMNRVDVHPMNCGPTGRELRQAIDGLRWLPPAVREEAEIVVVVGRREHIDETISRALALAVRGELAQVVLEKRG